MRAHIYRRKGESPHWHAQVYVGGKRYRFSCQTEDKSTAREYARQRVEELNARHDRGLVGLPEPVRMSEVSHRYEREYAPRLRASSWNRAATVLKQAADWFIRGPLHDPQVGHAPRSPLPARSANLLWQSDMSLTGRVLTISGHRRRLDDVALLFTPSRRNVLCVEIPGRRSGCSQVCWSLRRPVTTTPLESR